MKIFIIIICSIFISCASDKNLIEEKSSPEKSSKITSEVSANQDVHLGWSDQDTYTVKIISRDIDSAIDAARHKILHDIVKVRMLNESRFTDISKISQEFEKPLKNGRVLSQQPVTGGIEIYYQITDKDLRQKFERK
jgi:hypothetical protein